MTVWRHYFSKTAQERSKLRAGAGVVALGHTFVEHHIHGRREIHAAVGGNVDHILASVADLSAERAVLPVAELGYDARAPTFQLKHQAIMPGTAIYTDLSGYYDLMCADIDYRAQSHCIHRLQQLFGNAGNRHLDLACGTGPHVRHFIDAGYESSGLDINQPMLDRATIRCPEAQFSLQDMCGFTVDQPVDLITCFLYSIHYSAGFERLKSCIARVHGALDVHGLFCFNAVDKNTIDNGSYVSHAAKHADGVFSFSSGWNYRGDGEQQSLKLRIEKTIAGQSQVWHDEHAMVAVSFGELVELLQPYFEVHVLEHDYEKIIPWNKTSGNAIFACVKI